MTKSKATRRALIFSVLSLILCFSMLTGTTYAWFTDTVASTGNIIQSGILDVGLVDLNGNSLEGKPLAFQKAAGAPADEEVLWEPGCTYNLEDFKVKNLGNLAFKFKIYIKGIDGDAKLLEAIDWTVTNLAEPGEQFELDKWYHLKPGEVFPEDDGLGIRLTGHMREDAGNEYQNLECDGVSIMIYAIQDTVEYDSFDNQYDAFAQVPEANVTFSEPQNAIAMFPATDRAAIINHINNPTDFTGSDMRTLAAKYQFSASEADRDSAYAHWNADFVVYADRDVPANDIILAGQYDIDDSTSWAENGIAFPWIYLQNTDWTVPAGTQVRLLAAHGFDISYEDVFKMKEFNCGLADVSGTDALDGITVTVELRLYKTEKVGGSYVETGADDYIVIGTTNYTFGQ